MNSKLLKKPISLNWRFKSVGYILIILTFFSFNSEVVGQILLTDFPCYTVSEDNGAPNFLFTYDPVSDQWNEVGITGTAFIEAIATDPVNDILYAADGGTLGTIDPATGLFTAIGPAGAGNGSIGLISFDDLDGLSYDPNNEILWASHRIGGLGPGTNDLILKIDPSTGAFIPGEFVNGDDYAVVEEASDMTFNGDVYDVDDIAYNPYTDVLYAIQNQDGPGLISEINKFDGSLENVIFDFNDDDVEGLGITYLSELYATTGDNGATGAQNTFIFIDVVNQTTQTLNDIDPTGNAVDFESFDCLTGVNDLALKKVIASTQTQPIQDGDTVNYEITVYNQGDITNVDILLSDYIPTGLTLIDPAWTSTVSQVANYTIPGPLVPGGVIAIPLQLSVNPGFNGTLTNYAEISESFNNQIIDQLNGGRVPLPDVDSTPDNLNEEATGLLIDNQINGAGPNANQDEDDHDIASFAIGSCIATGQEFFPCYTVSEDNGAPNTLFYFDQNINTWTKIGITGTSFVEAIAADPVNNILYAVDGGTLGRLDVLSGAFTAIGQVGSGNGEIATVLMDDIDGLTYDPVNKVLYGSHRIGGSGPGTNDLLIQIDPLTGALIPSVFEDTNGNPSDYAIIQEAFDGTLGQVVYDVDDIALNPYTSELFAIQNQDGPGLISVIDKISGRLDRVIYDTPDDDMEGLGFNGYGELFATSGDNGITGSQNSFISIDYLANSTTVLSSIDPTGENVDFESFDCFAGFNDLALQVTLAGGQAGPFCNGDLVTFDVTVYNQGLLTNDNIVISNYFPSDLILTDDNWADQGNGTATAIIPCPFSPGQVEIVPITFEVNIDGCSADANSTTIENYAEITQSFNPYFIDGNGNQIPLQDVDSTPDFTNNEINIIDNEITQSGGANEDEDDHDIETIEIISPQPLVGSLSAVNPSICFDGISAEISATLDGNVIRGCSTASDPSDFIVPEGYNIAYVLTSGTGLVIEDIQNMPTFTVSAGGDYAIHTLIYDPATLNVNVIIPGVTTALEVNDQLVQGGGTVCAALDISGAAVTVVEADPGTLTLNTPSPVCFEFTSAKILFSANGDASVPNGYQIIYLLAYGSNQVIADISNTAEFSAVNVGDYSIHTLVYDPTSFNLSSVIIDSTTVLDLQSTFTNGTICGSFDETGIIVKVERPDSGSLVIDPQNVCATAQSATVTATIGTNPIVPADYEIAYLLVDVADFTIEQINIAPDFNLTNNGQYSMHTLVFNPATLDLTTINLGTTGIVALSYQLTQGGGSICAALDVGGTLFTVSNPTAGSSTLTVTNPLCIDVTSATIEATANGDSNVPDGYQEIYILAYGPSKIIEGISPSPNFSAVNTGSYSIHSFVFNPIDYNLSNIILGTTTINEVETVLAEAGGNICGSLDETGNELEVVNPQTIELNPLSPVCLFDGMATVEAEGDFNSMPFSGYQVVFVLSTQNVLVDSNQTEPSFTINSAGDYTIHSLVYNPSVLDLSTINFGTTTATEVNNLLVQGGGNICAALDFDGATVTVGGGVEVSLEDGYPIPAVCGQEGAAFIEVTTGQEPFTYTWSDGFTQEDRPSLPAGSYSVAVSDDNGCQSLLEFTILGSQSLDLVITESCEQSAIGSDAVLDYTISGGNMPYTIVVTDANGVDISPDVSGALPEWNTLAEGQYNISIEDTDGCTDSQSFVICPYTCLLEAEVIATVNATCNGLSNGSILISSSTNMGAEPITYTWLSGDGTVLTDQTSEVAEGLSAGSYEVQLEDVNGCTLEVTAQVTEPDLLVFVDCNAEDVTTTGGSNGSATVVVEGGTPPYSYLWSDGQTTVTATNLQEGNYQVAITDASGCETMGSCDVQGPSCSGFDSNNTATAVSCNGAADGTIEISTIGANGAITYSWTPDVSTSALATALDAGTYEILVRDAAGCEETVVAEIVQPAELTAVIGKADVVCFGEANGSLDLQISGGTEPYNFSWNNGVSTEDQTGLGPGNYSVTVLDVNDCLITLSDEILEPTILEEASEANLVFVSCPGDSDGAIDISITGGAPPYQYNWSNGATTEDLSNIIEGDYTVTVTDNNGCDLDLAYTIQSASSCAFDLALSLNLASTQLQVVAEGSDVNYEITLENQGLIDATEVELIIYIPTGLTLNDSNWMMNTNPGLSGFVATTTLTSLLTAGSTELVGLTMQVDNGATPGDIVLFSEILSAKDDNGLLAEDIDSTPDSDVSNDAGGSVDTPSDDTRNGDGTGTPLDEVAATDEDDHDPEEVTVTEPIVVTAIVQDAICGENGSAALTVTGGTPSYSYQWSDGFSLIDRTDLPPGNYSVSVTDANGFSATAAVTIQAPPPVELIIAESCEQTATGGDAVLDYTVAGGATPYTIELNDENGASISPDVPGALPEWNMLSEGQYDITITDADGCEATESFIICPYTCLLAAELVSTTDVKCNGGSDGSITIAATTNPGADPITYVWLSGDGTVVDGQTTETVTGLTAGAYEVQLEDANGCTLELTFEINEPSAFVFIDCNAEDVTTTGGNNGTATVVAEGGTAPYTYIWSDGQTSNPAIDLEEGSYDVVITDVNGCETMGACNVQGPSCSGFDAAVNVTPATCNGDADGTIEISVVGGVGTITYNWSPNVATGSLATSLDVGVYEITVVDAAGCQESLIAEILEPAELTAVIGKADVVCFGQANGSLDLQLSGGTEPYNFSWNNGVNTEDQTGVGPGNYSVTVLDANDCIITLNDEILEPELLQEASEANLTFVACPGDSDGAIDISITGGATPYQYNWSNGATSEDLSNIAEGDYTVTVTDNNGCELELSYTIESASSCAFDLALYMVLSPGEPNVVAEASDVNFEIIIENQGLIDATDVELIVYIPDGLTLNDVNWAMNSNPGLSGFVATSTITNTLVSGATEMVGLTMSVGNGATPGDIVIFSEILSAKDDNGMLAVDIDSTPDSDMNNDAGGAVDTASDDTIDGDGTGVPQDEVGATDEDDHDPVKITITNPIIVTAIVQDAICGENGSAVIEVTGGTPTYRYQWSDGFSLADRQDLSPGNYSLSVTDANGFSAVADITILAPAPVELIIAESCERTASGGDAILDYNITGGATPYNIDITDNNGTLVAPMMTGELPVWNTLAEGQYDITVTDADGCITTESFVICPYTCLLDAELVSTTDVKCNAGNDGAITIAATTNPGADPITYLWLKGDGTVLDGQNGETATGLTAGAYEVQLEDVNGCMLELTFEINEPAAFVFIDCNAEDVTTTGGNNGTATVVAEGGTAPYTYLWSNGQTSNPAIDLEEGSYDVVITDANGCETNGTCDVQGPSCSGFDAAVNVTPSTCNADADGIVEISSVGGTGTITYSWLPDVSTGALATALDVGVYEITVVDAAGCQESLIAEILEPAELTGAIAKSDVVCFGEANGSLDLQLSGGTEPYSFSWNNGIDTEDQTNLEPGNYSVTVLDANGCLLMVNDEITEPALLEELSDEAIITNLNCEDNANASIDITVTGGSTPYQFNWSNGETSEDIEGLSEGTYTVTITDNNGCQVETSYDIESVNCNADLALTLGLAENQEPVVLEGDVNFEITLENQGEVDAANIDLILYIPEALQLNDANWVQDTSPTFSGFVATTTLSGILAAGEINQVDISFSIADTPFSGDVILAAEIVQAIDPYGDLFDDNDSTPDSISDNDAGGAVDSPSDDTRDGDGTGTPGDEIAATDEDDHDPEKITIAQAIALTIEKKDAICGENGSADITVSGGTAPYTFQWSDGFSLEDRESLEAGNYSVSVTDANGFTGVGELTILAPAPVELIISESCERTAGGSDAVLDYTITGGAAPYDIEVTDAEGQTVSADISGDTPEWNNLGEGQYDIVVVDADGCSTGQSFVICAYTCLLDGELVSLSNVTCNGFDDGSITITASTNDGAEPISYTWLKGDGTVLEGQTTETVTGLTAGAYEVQLEDVNGCALELTFEIDEPQPLVFIDCNAEDVTTTGGNNGTATVVVEGGVAPYTYLWSNDQTTNPALDLEAGNYEVTITDGNGCETSGSCDVQSPSCSAFDAEANVIPVSCNGVADGSIEISVVGSTGTVAYSWSDDVSSGALATDLEAGVYEIQVKDAAGCQESLTAEILQPTELTAVIAKSDVTCFGEANGSLDLQLAGGTEPYTFNWNNGEDTEDLTDLGPGDYSVTILDANDCVIITSDSIDEPELLQEAGEATITSLTCLEDNIGSIDVSATGGATPYQFNWSNGETTEDLSDLTEGTYTITITDNNGCEFESAYEIEKATSCESDLALIVELASGQEEDVEVGNQVTLTITVTNQGIDDLSDIELIAYLPEGLNLNDPLWTGQDENSATISILGTLSPGEETTLDITLEVSENATPGELFTYVEILGATNSLGEPYLDVDSKPDAVSNNDAGAEPNTSTDNSTAGTGEDDEDDHDVAALYLRRFDLALQTTLAGDSPIAFSPGQEITLLVVVTNQGSIDAYDIVVNQLIPNELVLNDENWTQNGDIITTTFEGPLLAGELATIPVVFTIPAGTESGALEIVSEIVSANTSSGATAQDSDSTPDDDFTNDAGGAVGTPSDNVIIGDGSGNPGDGVATTDEDDHDPVIILIEDILIDLEIFIEVMPQVVFSGDIATWTISVTNQGPDDATGVTVLNDVDTGLTHMSDTGNGSYDPETGIWNIGDVDEGETMTIEIETTVTEVTAISIITQVQTANEPDVDSTPGNNIPEEDDQNQAEPLTSIATVSIADPCDCENGIDIDDDGQIDYAYERITITSSGSGELWNLTSSSGLVNVFGNEFDTTALTDVGDGTYILDAYVLADGVTSYTASFSESNSGNTVSTTGGSCDPCPLPPPPVQVIDLEVGVEVFPDVVYSGDVATWTITVTNNGPHGATGVTLLNQLDDGLSYVSDTGNGNFNPETGIWNVGDIANGTQTTLQIVASITDTEEMSLTAQVQTADQPDVDSTPGNNVASEDDQDSSGPSLSIRSVSVTDPCNCDQGIDSNGDGNNDYAYEKITLVSNSAGELWELTAVVGLVNADGNSFNVTPLTDIGNGTYVLDAYIIADGTTTFSASFTERSSGNVLSLSGGPCSSCPQINTNNPPYLGPDQMLCTEPVTEIAVCVSLFDPDGDNVSILDEDVKSAFNCSTNVFNDSCFTYIPLPGLMGTDTVTVIGCDDGYPILCDTLIALIEITRDCDGLQPTDCLPGTPNPIIYDCTAPVTPLEICVPDFCALDDETEQILNATTTFNCSINLMESNCLTYTPLPGFEGVDTVEIIGIDITGATDTVYAYIELSKDCGDLIINDDDVTITPGETVTIDVLENDINNSDCTDDELVLTLVTQPLYGEAVINDDGTITYIPDEEGEQGNDSFVYQVCCVDECGIGTVNITVDEVVLMVVDDNVTVPTGGTTTIDVLENDINNSDCTNDELIITIETMPTMGVAVLNADGTIDYTPNENAAGSDSLTYQICCEDICDSGTVFISIGDGEPDLIAVDDNVIVPPGDRTNIDVLNNDINNSDCTDDELTVTIITPPTMGNAIVQDDGTIDYLAFADGTGTDMFEYEVCCNEECDQAIVNIAFNRAPIAVNDIDTTGVDEPITLAVLDNDSDPDGHGITIEFVSTPSNGSAVIFEDNITYVPEPGFVGIDSFTYVICDTVEAFLCDTATIIIVVEDRENNPPVIMDSLGNPLDTAFASVNIGDTLIECISVTDPDGDNILVEIIGTGNLGMAEMINDTCFSYVPDMVGIDTLIIVACDDGQPPACDTLIYIIDVMDMDSMDNQPPIALNDTISTDINTSIVIPVLINDEEPDGEPTTLEIVEDPMNGELTINQDGTIEYVPDMDFVGIDSFKYVICDPEPLCDTATVFIIVGDALQAIDDNATTDINESVSIDVCENDIFTGEIEVIFLAQATNGTTSQDGCIVTYTPNEGFIGINCFEYVIQDAFGQTDTAEVCITVEGDPVVEEPDCPAEGLEGRFPQFLAENTNGDILPWEVTGIDVCCDSPTIYIFNRWGNFVYKNEAYQPGDVWRGEHHENADGNNQLVPDGTYFYCVVCPNEADSGEDKKHTGFIHVETD